MFLVTDTQSPYTADRKFFRSDLSMFQFLDKYARWNEREGRRETWREAVRRVTDYLAELSNYQISKADYDEIYQTILNQEVMPSMRLVAMAGPAARREPVSLFNCSYVPIDGIDALAEILYLSMNGVGVGFSVENQYIQQFPVPASHRDTENTLEYTIEDSTEGWCNAFKIGLTRWLSGKNVIFNYVKIRPAGTPLKTKGGVASGPEPLKELLAFTRSLLRERAGQHLTSLDVYDIACKIADCVVMGGVRRCLPEGTGVQTSLGLKNIENVVIGDMVVTEDGYKRVSSVFDQGKQQTIVLNLENGSRVTCTPNHKVAVVNDVFGSVVYKRADALSENDRLVFVASGYDGDDNSDFHDLDEYKENDHVRTELKKPILNNDSAWVIGKFLADGTVTTTPYDERGKHGNRRVSFSFHSSETNQVKRVIEWFDSIGVKASVEERHDGNWVTVYTCVRRVANWFLKMKVPNIEIRVPEFIKNASREIRSSFLAGVLDGDGTIRDRPLVLCTTVYCKFAHDIQNLCASLGIIAEIKIRRKQSGNMKQLYFVSVKDFNALRIFTETILKHSTKKSKYRQRIRPNFGYTYDRRMLYRDVRQKDYRNFYNMTQDSDPNSYRVNEITGSHKFVPVRVISVEPGETLNTYDIEVEDKHSFVIENGILVHNSAFLTLFDFDDTLMLNAKNGDMAKTPWRYNSNNSAVWPDRQLDEEEVGSFFEVMNFGANGEPGIFSRRAVLNTMPQRRDKNHQWGLNPCLTGETLVAVADGRGAVRFDELSQEGKDVPVYTLDINGNPTVRMMRNPRITGKQQVYRITFNDGTFIRATENHKFLLKSGEYRRVDELAVGDSVDVMTRYIASMHSMTKLQSTSYIVSIEPDGIEYVYNGTVDEHHNYFVGGFQTESENGHVVFLNCLNCGESVLRPLGLCNLSSIVARHGDTLSDLSRKARVAALIGTIQSLATKFNYLRPEWQHNAEEERLLGVDLTGQYDCEAARNKFNQIALKAVVVRTNKEYADRFGIPQSAATTVVKPSGNSGVLLDVSSGIHPRWSAYYIRNVRVNKDSPMFKVFEYSGVKMVPDRFGEEEARNWVVGFPVASPKGAVTRRDLNALDQLEYWKQVKTCWTEHAPSCTIYYGIDEHRDVIQWLYENQDIISGLSFFPRFDTTYNNAPYVEIQKSEYERLLNETPRIDFSVLQMIESADGTTTSGELACAAGKCEL